MRVCLLVIAALTTFANAQNELGIAQVATRTRVADAVKDVLDNVSKGAEIRDRVNAFEDAIIATSTVSRQELQEKSKEGSAIRNYFDTYVNDLTVLGDNDLLLATGICATAYGLAFCQFHSAKDSWFPPIPTSIAGGMTAQVIKQIADKFMSYEKTFLAFACTVMWFVSSSESAHQWNIPSFAYAAASAFTIALLRSFSLNI